MNGSAAFLVAFFTSVATSVGTVYLVDRLQLIDSSAQSVTVPQLVGLDETAAKVHATNQGLLVLIAAREASDDQPEGTVLAQTVPAGQKVAKGNAIAITIAKAVFKVPDLAKMTAEDAVAALEEAGYVAEEKKVSHAEIEAGTVVAQKPKKGTVLEKGSSVTVEISDGPAEVEVPKVISQRLAEAKKTLEDAGFEPKVRWVSLAETWSGVVLSQTPEPGDKAKKGAEVEIVINTD